MKKCAWTMLLMLLAFPAVLWAQTDTVDVVDFFSPGGGEGTLNTAIQAKITAGTLSNTVFRLKPYGLYVLSSTITVPAGKKLTLIAPDPGSTQETAPPMICWTASSGVTQTFNFDCYGDVYLKNIWILYATTNTEGLGTQVGSAFEIDQDTTDNVNNAAAIRFFQEPTSASVLTNTTVVASGRHGVDRGWRGNSSLSFLSGGNDLSGARSCKETFPTPTGAACPNPPPCP